jgi:hypothetical protein
VGGAVDIVALLHISGQHLVLGQDVALFDTTASQRFDYLQHLDVQVSFTPDIAAAAERAVPQGVYEPGGKIKLTVQLGQGGVQESVARIKIVSVSHINRALSRKPAAFYVVKVD